MADSISGELILSTKEIAEMFARKMTPEQILESRLLEVGVATADVEGTLKDAMKDTLKKLEKADQGSAEQLLRTLNGIIVKLVEAKMRE